MSSAADDTQLRSHVERALKESYDLEDEIGRGGMGIVYRARDKRLKRTVAIKLLPPELAFRSEIKTRFLREAETAAQLNHPHIVPIYSVDERDGLVFFVMTCVTGKTLGGRLQECGRLSVDETRKIMREVSDALAYAHGRGVIHRDIKPDNILLDAESGRSMVTDFGIARAIQEGGDSRLTATGMAIGTPAYMSPEQAVGDRVIDGRSDLYSLGVLGYQMLVGEPPFIASSTPAMLMKHLTEVPTSIRERRPDVPADLDATIMTLLAKEPERRLPSAGALSLALQGEYVVAYPQLQSTDHVGRPAYMPAAERSRDTRPGYQQGGSAPMYPGAYAPPALAEEDSYSPTGDDLARWLAEPVVKYRKKFATFAAVNAVILLAAIFGEGGFLSITVIWGMFMAANYAKLWSSGYDWRDVFRQHRDRRLVDVAHETVAEVRGVFDRERKPGQRSSGGRLGGANALPTAGRAAGNLISPPAETARLGAHAHTVRKAESDRAEILRIVDSLPKNDRSLVTDVVPSAEALMRRIQSLASSLAELERSNVPDATRQMDDQIGELEAQANPLDRVASEDRVRRLALLKRQRRALADQERRRGDAASKLESCSLALGSMRLDVLRLRAGSVSQSVGQITLLTERARLLADDVDAAVYAADEIGKLTSGRREVGGGRRQKQ
ncbi:MAG: serine/threonine protein kinase [Anaerolineae bacterium]|nr:serine/threonine protein kinase [Gemmatimonadaceae bacterium]